MIHIYQPRINHIDSWEISTKDLLAFGEFAHARAKECLLDNSPRLPGDSQCQFCKAKATCKALESHVHSVIGDEFDNLESVETVNIKNVLDNKSLIEGWLKSVEAYAMDTIQSGGDVDGYKLVSGRSLRAWRDESKVIETLSDKLGDKLYTKKMVTVAQAEKLVGKKAFSDLSPELVVKPDGKPTLVPVTDKREALKNIADMFD